MLNSRKKEWHNEHYNRLTCSFPGYITHYSFEHQGKVSLTLAQYIH